MRFAEMGVAVEPVPGGRCLHGKLRLSLTPFASLEGSRRYESVSFATVGATWNPSRWLVLDLGCVVGLNDDMPDFQLTLGFTESLGRLVR